MIIFDQLRISDNGSQMYINVHVNEADYFEGIFLDSITIMTSDKVSETDPNVPTEDYIYKKVYNEDTKEDALVLTVQDFLKTWEDDPQSMLFKAGDMSKTLFFVYVQVRGVLDPETPCNLDKEYTVGVTFDANVLHERVMYFTKELVKSCQIPLGYVDFILLWYAYKSAIETEHFVMAIDFWHMLFDHVNGISDKQSKSCGCYG